jgi:hypothetical protein
MIRGVFILGAVRRHAGLRVTYNVEPCQKCRLIVSATLPKKNVPHHSGQHKGDSDNDSMTREAIADDPTLISTLAVQVNAREY